MKVVLIIEDDYPFALEIEMMLMEVGGYLPKIVSTFAQAEKILQSLKPDIILSDIHLDQNYTVFDLLKIEYLDIPLVLFSSIDSEEVYNRAKSLKSYIFLIKPFNVKSLRSAIENLLFNIASKSNIFFVKSDGKNIAIDASEIRYIESSGNYSNIFLLNETVVTRATFENITKICQNPFLMRIHRGYIINIKYIESVQSSIHINMKFGGVIPIGRKYKSEIKELISQ